MLSKLIGWTFMRSVEQCVATTCYVATAPALSQTSGYFFEHCNPILAGGYTEDSAMADELWDVSEELTAGYV